MSEANRTAEPAPAQEPGADETTAGELDADGKRGRRRSKTMSRKEIARELRRQRAFGLVDPELHLLAWVGVATWVVIGLLTAAAGRSAAGAAEPHGAAAGH